MWKVSIDGGDAVKIIDQTSAGLAISPDGKWIASAHFEPADIKTAIYPVEGGEPHKILDIHTVYIRWTPDGRALAYLDDKNLSNISIQTIDGGSTKQLTDFKPGRVFSFAWSPDGKQLAIARGSVNKDVILISNFRDRQ